MAAAPKRVLLWALLAGAVLAVPAIALMRAEPELSVLFELPAFELVDQRGEPFSRADLEGRPWIVDFIYTRCSAACPMLTARMRQARQRLTDLDGGERVGLLSVTVDPERDTPERLAEYAAPWEGEGTWVFATGEKAAVEAAVVKGFRIAMGEPPPGERTLDDFEILHGERMVLVDPQGRIRGYYEASAEGVERVAEDAARLAR